MHCLSGFLFVFAIGMVSAQYYRNPNPFVYWGNYPVQGGALPPAVYYPPANPQRYPPQVPTYVTVKPLSNVRPISIEKKPEQSNNEPVELKFVPNAPEVLEKTDTVVVAEPIKPVVNIFTDESITKPMLDIVQIEAPNTNENAEPAVDAADKTQSFESDESLNDKIVLKPAETINTNEFDNLHPVDSVTQDNIKDDLVANMELSKFSESPEELNNNVQSTQQVIFSENKDSENVNFATTESVTDVYDELVSTTENSLFL